MDRYYFDENNQRIIRSEEGKMMYEYFEKRSMLWHPTYFHHPKSKDAFLDQQDYKEITLKEVIHLIKNWKTQ